MKMTKEKQIKPDERIDRALESVLNAAGTSLKNYSIQSNLDNMREAMRKIMSESYIDGSDAVWKIAIDKSGK